MCDKLVDSSFWIQEQAIAGNWYDSIGLDRYCTQDKANEQLASWQISYPARKFRLVVRVDVVLNQPKDA